MTPALLLVDVQQDYLARPGLSPEAGELVSHLERLLTSFRANCRPVFHIQTLVKSDGSDVMPHWKSRDQRACVEGTRGALPPSSLLPQDGELVVRKKFFSGFESGALHETLAARGIDTVVLAGLYTHACIRATALDAYALGYHVRVASDSVASPEPAHAELSRQWMDAREMRFISSPALLAEFGWSPLAEPVSEGVVAATRVAREAQSGWANTPLCQRTAILSAWTNRLKSERENLARLLAGEIGKPLTDSAEEVDRAVAHIVCAIRLAESAAKNKSVFSNGFFVRHRPVGTVALITPWNNPLAIPAGKIAPALAFGNTVVWKPSPAAPRSAQALLDAAAFPPGLVEVMSGGPTAARELLTQPGIAAVSFTGSNSAGAVVAALCSVRGIPLQAELGGNNAALVLADADLELAARSIVFSAFGFAGQRCTATRRIIVEKSVCTAFQERLVAQIQNLILGDPLDSATQVGPLISREHRDRVAAVVQHALAAGHGRLLCGGSAPQGLAGNWFSPTLIAATDHTAPIVREETFGPVAVVLPAEDFEQALVLCNAVEQGLVASVFSRDPAKQARFLEMAEAGILRINPARHPVDPDAPFLGWKSSGVGPPEHGRWDLEFYSRPQAVYGTIG